VPSAAFVQRMGRKILVIGFRGCGHVQALGVTDDARRGAPPQPASSTRVLNGVTDAPYDSDLPSALQDLAESNTPYVKASAGVGVAGPKGDHLQHGEHALGP